MMQSLKRKMGHPGEVASSSSSNKKIKTSECDKENTAHNNSTTSAAIPLKASEQHSSHGTDVMTMKVAQLRKELKALGLETTGVKKDLQQRLLQAVNKPTKKPLIVAKSPFTSSATDQSEETREEQQEEPVKEDQMSIVPLEDKPSDGMSIEPISESKITNPEVTKSEQESVKKATEEDEPAISLVEIKQSATLKPHPSIVKTAAALFSPKNLSTNYPRPQEQKPKTRSPLDSIKRGFVQSATQLLSVAVKNSPKKLVPVSSPKPDPVSPPKPDERSAAREISATIEADKLSSAIKSSGQSSSMESSISVAVSSNVKEKQKQLAEARKQRLAEMRGKSKPLSTSNTSLSSATKVAAASATKLVASSTTKTDEKRTLLNAKIREKHAALKNQGLASTNSTGASALKSTGLTSSKETPRLEPPKLVSKPLNQSYSSVKHSVKFQPDSSVRSKAMSPLDTYEISDREESDSDESDYNDSGPKKKIPDWAQKHNLITALKEQYDDTNDRFDPDGIFPEVETCDLEAIFDQKKMRYKKRTSSGNWHQDRVTVAEKLTYKRAMGYDSNNT
jgi:hypothetical protein